MKTDHIMVWSEVHADKSITIGFTKKCIEEMLPECFHVMQADATTIREKGPMLVLETNDGLESIKSPFTGKISYFNSKARNYPDKLTETDTILTILPPGVEAAKPKVVSKPAPAFEYLDDWAQMPFVAPPAQAPQEPDRIIAEARQIASAAAFQRMQREQAENRQRNAQRQAQRVVRPRQG